MARIYQMPPDTREKEKIIGGIFTISQFVWIVLGIVLYVLCFLALFRPLRAFAFVPPVPFLVFGFVFALKKVGDLPLPVYLKYKRQFKKKTKIYINSGVHDSLDFSTKEGA